MKINRKESWQADDMLEKAFKTFELKVPMPRYTYYDISCIIKLHSSVLSWSVDTYTQKLQFEKTIYDLQEKVVYS